jgi:hypothetical protein
METKQNNHPDEEIITPKVSRGIYNPVTVELHDTVGAIVLGLISIILLIGWIASEMRHGKNQVVDD